MLAYDGEPVPRLELRYVRDVTAAMSRPFRAPDHVHEFASLLFDDSEINESLWCIHLDARNRPVGAIRHSTGGWSASVVKPREILAGVLLSGAVGFILVHNHPSGETSPSHEDIQITRQMIDAAKIVGLALIDHVIVGTGPAPQRPASFKERGLL